MKHHAQGSIHHPKEQGVRGYVSDDETNRNRYNGDGRITKSHHVNSSLALNSDPVSERDRFQDSQTLSTNSAMYDAYHRGYLGFVPPKMQPLDNLQQIYERYKSWKQVSQDCIDYVDLLKSQIDRLNMEASATKNDLQVARKEASQLELAFEGIDKRIFSLMRELHPDCEFKGDSLGILVEQYKQQVSANEESKRKLEVRSHEHRKELDELSNRSATELLNLEKTLKSKHKQELKGLENHIQQLNYSHTTALKTEKDSYSKDLKQQEVNYEQKIANLTIEHADERAKVVQQNHSLRASISRLGDPFETEPDDKLIPKFRALKSSMAALARPRNPRTEVDLGEQFDAEEFTTRVERRHHKFVLEQTLWLLLIQNIFVHPFKAFDETGDQFWAQWTFLFPTGKELKSLRNGD